MRTHVSLWAPDNLAGRGGAEPRVTPEVKTPADREPPAGEGQTPDTETGGQRISGPGPNNLTRGLP